MILPDAQAVHLSKVEEIFPGMHNSAYKAHDLSADQRRVLEALLGRAIGEDETVTVRASPGSVIREAPAGEKREEVFRRLDTYAEEMGQRVKGVPEEELSTLIDEAVMHARSQRR